MVERVGVRESKVTGIDVSRYVDFSRYTGEEKDGEIYRQNIQE